MKAATTVLLLALATLLGPSAVADPAPTRPKPDAPVRRARAGSVEASPIPPTGRQPVPPLSAPATLEGGQPLAMQAALYGAVTNNPDLVALRNNNIASPESVEVARRFPTTLNPTFWVDVRPFVYERVPGHARSDRKDTLMYFSIRQPLELGHQTTHRHRIAQAAYSQQQWLVVQAELTTLVQTHRFFQTAAYRREKLRVARNLADFNDRLLRDLKKGFESNRVSAADLTLAEVENQATRQLVDVARQDYAVALTDLHNQIGTPDTAGKAEPVGAFVLAKNVPDLDEQALVQIALQSRPEIHAARAGVAGSCAAVDLAKGDTIPTPVVGPIYERDEQGTQFIGFVYITPIPILNNGKPLVIQRQADYRRAFAVLQQAEQRATTQVKAAVAKWNGANRLVNQTTGLTDKLKTQVARMERLFDENQATLTQLLQARQRLIQLENAGLDALWQATQAQSDLLLALGSPCLINALQATEAPAATPAPTPTAPAPAAPPPTR